MSPQPIKLAVGNERFWATPVEGDFDPPRAVVDSVLLADDVAYGDTVEYNGDRCVLRIVERAYPFRRFVHYEPRTQEAFDIVRALLPHATRWEGLVPGFAAAAATDPRHLVFPKDRPEGLVLEMDEIEALAWRGHEGVHALVVPMPEPVAEEA